jgi:hypothetical protein
MADPTNGQLFVNGGWVPPARGKYLDVINPATEEVFGRIANATVEDVNAAVASAAQAHKDGTWARSTGKQRAVILRAIAEKVPYTTCSSSKTSKHPHVSSHNPCSSSNHAHTHSRACAGQSSQAAAG